MKATNRPYVDPVTEPGDAGTEPWADDRANAEADDRTKDRSAADRASPAPTDAAIEGSPADEFLTNEDAISARDKDADPPTGD
jgi:hypothetical protein